MPRLRDRSQVHFIYVWEGDGKIRGRTAPSRARAGAGLVNTHAVERDGSRLLTGRRVRAAMAARGHPAVGPDRRVEPLTRTWPRRTCRTSGPQDDRAGNARGSGRPDGAGSGEARTDAGAERRTQVALVSDDEGRVAMVPFGTGAGWLGISRLVGDPARPADRRMVQAQAVSRARVPVRFLRHLPQRQRRLA